MVLANSLRRRVRAGMAGGHRLLVLFTEQGGRFARFATVPADKRYRIAIATQALFTRIAAAVRELAAQPQ